MALGGALAVLLGLGASEGLAQGLPDGGPAAEKAGAAGATVQADRQEVRLGEPFHLTIQVRDPAGRKFGLDPEQALDPFVELGRVERADRLDGQGLQVLELKLAVYDRLGSIEVPALKLVPLGADGGAGEPLELPAVPLRVRSVLEGVDQPQPKDVAAPVSVRVPDFRLLVWAGLLALMLGLGLVLWRLRPSELPEGQLEELPPPRLAHEVALEKLQAVIAEDLLRQGRLHEYFVRVSEAVREYVGNRYGFFALDRTTREMLEELRDRITPGLDLGQLSQLLQQADRVKFAREQPGDESCSSVINAAFQIIEATRVREEPAGSAEAAS